MRSVTSLHMYDVLLNKKLTEQMYFYGIYLNKLFITYQDSKATRSTERPYHMLYVSMHCIYKIHNWCDSSLWEVYDIDFILMAIHYKGRVEFKSEENLPFFTRFNYMNSHDKFGDFINYQTKLD